MEEQTARLAPGTEVRVSLRKQGRPKLEYAAKVIFDDGVHLVIRGIWAEPAERDLGYVRFEPGDVWTEHYWRDRWYSVKEVRERAGRLKGWYCDVARPVRLSGRLIVTEDMDLDLWVSADQRIVLRLDEDEFVASGIVEEDPASAARAMHALEELERLARDGFRTIAL